MFALRYEKNTLTLDHHCPEPVPAEGESLIKVVKAGICNTDIEITKGYMGFEGIPGHEFTGIVEKHQDQSMIGRRVVGEINCYCNQCSTCKKGDVTHCPDRSTLGIHNRNGVFAEYCTLPDHLLHEIPDSLSDEEAVFAEPVAAALEISERIHIRPSDHVYVLGDGKLGILTAQVIRLTGCDLTVVGKNNQKLDILNQMQIRTVTLKENLNLPKADMVIDCTGNPSGLDLSVKLLKPRGKLVLKSTFHGDNHVNLTSFVVDEITLIGSRCGPFSPALRLLEQKLIQVKPLINEVYDLENGIEAFDKAREKESLKVLVSCSK